MPKLHVVSQDTLDHMIAEGVDLRGLVSPKDIVSSLSADDVAESEIAHRRFTFGFDPVLDIEPQPSIMTTLSAGDDAEQYDRLRTRVTNRVESTILADQAMAAQGEMWIDYIYTLHPVDDNLWVVGAQRRTYAVSDPQRLGFKKNQAFFDSVIAQSLHLLPFETVSSTNLFAYYLKSISD